MKEDLKQRLVNEMGDGCAICGYNYCLAALHFHHINSFEKEFNISEKSNYFDIQDELDKVILLCNRCHVEAHQKLISPSTLQMLKDEL